MIDAPYGSPDSLTPSQNFGEAPSSSTVTESVSLSPGTSATQPTRQTQAQPQTTEAAEEVVAKKNLEELNSTASKIPESFKDVITKTAAVATALVDLASAVVQVSISAVTLVWSVGKLAYLMGKAILIIGNIAAENVGNTNA